MKVRDEIPRVRQANWILVLALLCLVGGATLAVLSPALSSSPGPRAVIALGAANLRQIGLSAQLYAGEHGGSFPANIQSLALYYPLASAVYICPINGHKPGDLRSVEQWSDSVLVPNRTLDDPADTVLAFTKPECYPGTGGYVCLVDGSANWYPLEEYQRLTAGLMP